MKDLAGGRDRTKEREGVSCSFIDKALGPEFAVEFWIKALAALIYVKAFPGLLIESCLMLLTGCDGFPFRMVCALHLPVLFTFTIGIEGC